MKIAKRIICHFGPEVVEKPYIYILVRQYDLVVNMIKAIIDPDKNGYSILEVEGEEKHFQEAMTFLSENGVSHEDLSDKVAWNQDLCFACGQCTGLCPTGALQMRTPDMDIHFGGDQCIACGMCVKACPTGAMEMLF